MVPDRAFMEYACFRDWSEVLNMESRLIITVSCGNSFGSREPYGQFNMTDPATLWLHPFKNYFNNCFIAWLAPENLLKQT